MKLHEYQIKHLIASYGLSVPIGFVCTAEQEVEKILSKIGSNTWLAKCQVHTGGVVKQVV